jgi:cytochrome P450
MILASATDTAIPFQASFQRKVLKPFTLSNGQVIPAGVIIELPAHAISHDPEVFDGSDKFDAFRYYNIRQKSGGKGTKAAEIVANNQFVSVGQSSLTFGYGRHACPGRFFAANEIKMIVSRVLMQYDMKMVDGITERYPNIEYGGQVSEIHVSIPNGNNRD